MRALERLMPVAAQPRGWRGDAFAISDIVVDWGGVKPPSV
jgi:hypothetical protein